MSFVLDLGTTTISGSLVDLSSGDRLVAGTRPNPQAPYGADVITRLTLAAMSNKNALTLQRLVLGSAADLLQSLCKQASLRVGDVTSGVFVGNTAMHHLALGLDVSGLCKAPYTPACREAGVVELPGLPPLYAVPVIASFVGSDAVSAALATSLCETSGTRLLIDVGTNSEVLLWHGGTLRVASAPAGPAFEGGEISCGMLARPGAIDSVRFDGDNLQVTTIGGVAPEGICGSGLVDAVAALLQSGVLDESGRLQPRGPLRRSVIAGDGGATGFSIAPGVVLTQRDIRAFQLAKGAMLTAVDILLRDAGASPGEIDQVLLAGCFGTFLDKGSAVATGLIPPIEVSKVKGVGNAALAGAEMIAASRDAQDAAGRIARSAVHVELSMEPDFQERFLQSLNFHMAMPQGTR
ncbi:MAG: ASKHA domain-containing protein [Bacillota bacterium]